MTPISIDGSRALPYTGGVRTDGPPCAARLKERFMDLASRVSPAAESRLDAANGAAATRPEDLHTFLERWEREHPEEIAHVEKPIDARFEVTALITKLERQQKFPVVICHHVVSNGRRLEYPLVTFLMS